MDYFFCTKQCRLLDANFDAAQVPECIELWELGWRGRYIDVSIALASIDLPALLVYKIIARMSPPLCSAVPRFQKMRILEAVQRTRNVLVRDPLCDELLQSIKK